MVEDPSPSNPEEDALDQLRIENLKSWLQHLQDHPVDDADCVLELKLPLSMLTELMLHGAERNLAPQDVVRAALEQSGFGAYTT